MANKQTQVTIQLDFETLALLEEFAQRLGYRPEEWAEQVIRLWLGRSGQTGMENLVERLRRLEVPVRSWPEMERDLMRACLGEN